MSSVNLSDQIKVIDSSWKRCHSLGLSPTGPINNLLLTGKDLQTVLKENEYLIKHTTSILEKLYPSIHSSELVTVIVDRNGTIVHKIGKLEIEESLDYMSVGSNWSEEIKGTNAIGLAIHEKKPIITHAEHHFYVKNHFLTCAASPIYSPTREVIGAVNISARKELFHPFMISLTSIIAEAVQNRLLLEQANHEKVLALKEINHTANLYTFPLLTLDHEKRILRANQHARHLLGEDCIGKEFQAKQGHSIDILSDQSKKVFRSVISLHTTNKKGPQVNNLYTISDIIGSCEKIVWIRKMVNKAALTDYPIIIYGESGTGKELIAQSLHTAGSRKRKPFIAVNCSAIPENLIESELFGYERGAFTGANRDGAPGKFEAADGGTIFLDEIGDMPLKAQAALLRVLQEKTVTRIGGVEVKRIDTRVIAATNKNLREEVQSGRFREDLYYRLKGIIITPPALRNRSDIIELSEHLITKLDNPTVRLSEEAKQKLVSYRWPGNIRELNSILMQASFFAEGNEIKAEDLHFVSEYEQQTDSEEKTPITLINAEIDVIKRALYSVEWNISKAADILKISRNTLYLKIKKYNLH
ncbi:sigma-54-dependent Fis family transcriptional regulator [Neobacillus novalis]|uniref:Sigma-54-dependent Fis family transcriptional regulator n=1 Tax=Neobacillus novalis TaxID=220687 RepID=A0AA95SA70_9BACI|nr:sigma-54-dependent Fis family transcriptional regulator [Neobacillus novalis]WHY87795.1 sigma-54-dependent Fis family transcriptional regulator [Neobacillus novalis]